MSALRDAATKLSRCAVALTRAVAVVQPQRALLHSRARTQHAQRLWGAAAEATVATGRHSLQAPFAPLASRFGRFYGHAQQQQHASATFVRMYSAAAGGGGGSDDGDGGDGDDGEARKKTGVQEEGEDEDGDEEDKASKATRGRKWHRKSSKGKSSKRDDNDEEFSHVEDQVRRDAHDGRVGTGHADDDEVVIAHHRKRGSDKQGLLGPPVVPKSVKEAFVLPLHDRPILPNTVRILEIDDERVIDQISHLIRIRQPFVGTFLRSDDKEEIVDTIENLGEVETVGTLVSITDSRVLSNGRCHLFVQGHYPIKITSTVPVSDDDDEGLGDVHDGHEDPKDDREDHEEDSKEDVKEDSKEDSGDGERDSADVVGDSFTASPWRGSSAGGDGDGHGRHDGDEMHPLLKAKVTTLKMQEYDPQNLRLKALAAEVVTSLRDIVTSNSMLRDSVLAAMENRLRLDDYNQLCNLAIAATSADPHEMQQVLAELHMESKLMLTLEILKRELLNMKLQGEIRQQVETKVNEQRRKHLLHEQLQAIKKELGITKDETATLIDKFKAALEGLTVPERANEVIEEEMQKLSNLDPQSSEYQVTRNYLEWLTCIPWGRTSEEVFDVGRGLDILNEEHYGMTDVKDRILEFIAVSQLKGCSHGKILTFVGPPGVGKTSIAKSIAKALNREYYRFSVGGMNDVAEIKGHRRTYVGAIPGKPIQCLKVTKTCNPLILIDEVDKIGFGRLGDPSPALLELLDPEQNSGFLDHYLDVPVDFSKVLFVCTANVLDTIPGPLKDRMEIIELSGYMLHEKVKIAEDFLIPQAREATGVDGQHLHITAEALQALISGYCRESGVRSLRKQIEKIHRKAALKIVRGETKDGVVNVEADNLKEFVGLPLFTSDRMYDTTPPGVVMGLAWTAMGGSTLYIETVATSLSKQGDSDNTSGSLKLTGSLGDVMKESATIAYTFAKHYVEQVDSSNTYLKTADINLHVPEGATPKDGPSAGCTMVTAFLSLALNKPVRQDFAMTGEVSLTGKVLKVGGIKEKLLAARREGVQCVVLPEGNRPDFEDLPDAVKEGLEVHFARTYDDVYKIAFP
ncbi:Lonp1 protein [Salpingoeca rosetta]|uniref:Lon protease homolog n=1 Tax=Salpingoeca rosetta (strain ATCC 50818 / BSB-021) TaxID=946362 RepID=F2UKE7_SALR5|nr:Lonp1 protein [Salpingoeca rosetta]EGD77596.1 Lonp1 protein [Salpingoeca rosetta]|eukprot:XP_004990484.1 Lonp1 protein [Salpingoeca rosetta]